LRKIAKMIGLALRYTWITLAMFTGTHPPVRGAVTKMYTYHLDRAQLVDDKNTEFVVYYLQKKVIAMQQRKRGEAVTVSPPLKKTRKTLHYGHPALGSGSTGMKRFAFLIFPAFLFLIVQVGITSAATPATTSGITGGSIYFETNPPGATIWLDNIELGTSPLTYYSEKTGTLDVRLRKRLYEDYTDTVVVIKGERVVFYARLTPVPNLADETLTTRPVTFATTTRMSTIHVPTPWPTTSPESPGDPAVVIGAAAIGIGFFVIRRR